MQFATHDDFVRHIQTYGLPASDLPLAVRQAYAVAGMPVPVVRQQIGVITPPTAESGLCCHCGQPVPAGQHEALHAVAMFEHATHPETGQLLRLRVLHCDACHESDGCDPGTPGGFCTAIEEV